MSRVKFRHLEHTSDSIIEAYGENLEQAFENSACGLIDTMFDLDSISHILQIKIEISGYDLKSLLYDWLERILLLVILEKILLSDFKVKIVSNDNKFFLSCVAKGESLNLEKHGYKVEVKAITYHEMEIKMEKNKVIIKFLLDL